VGRGVILVIDCGLSFLKIALASPEGTIVHSDREPYATRRGDGRAEQDPADWWRALTAVIARMPSRSAVEMIVPTGHMHALVLTGADAQPLLPCLTLHDRRGAELLREFDPIGFTACTGQLLDASLPLAKLLWLADTHPELLDRTAALLAPKDYLGLRLTGTVATDPIDAAGTGLYDPRAQRWALDFAALGGLPMGALPSVRPSTHERGRLLPAVAEELGLRPGTPVAIGAGDDVELLGATGHAGDRAVEHVGTTGAILRSVDTIPAFTGPAVEVSPTTSLGRMAVGASTSNCGTVLDWIRSGLGIDPLSALDRAPRAGDPVALATLWPPRGGKRESAAAAPAGAWLSQIQPGHGRTDLARALLVAVAGELRSCLRHVEAASGEVRQIVTSGGTAALPWVKLRAAAYRRPIATLDGDPTALGCVAVGLVAAGVESTVESAMQHTHITTSLVDADPGQADVIDELLARAEDSRHAQGTNGTRLMPLGET
jgi:sugar (pentulose or hexulose) kinase